MAELTIISASRLCFIRRYTQTRGGTRLAVHRKYASREKTQVVLDEKKKEREYSETILTNDLNQEN